MYTPVLKWKLGERTALRELNPDVKMHVRPLVELHPDAIKEEFPDDVGRDWGSPELLLDSSLVEGEEVPPPARASTWIEWSASEFAKRGLRMVPVIPSQADPFFTEAVANVARRHGRGAALRIGRAELFAAGDGALERNTELDLANLELGPDQIDLVIDLGALLTSEAAAVRMATVGVLPSLSGIGPWRSLTLVAGGYPSDMGAFARGLTRCSRVDFVLWDRIVRRTGVDLMFGDYTAVHPVHPELDFRTMTPAAKVIYATEDEWLIAKGQRISSHPDGWGQVLDLCRLIGREPEFEGPGASWADNYIDRIITHQNPRGGATQWVAVRVNRHITVTVRALASYHGP